MNERKSSVVFAVGCLAVLVVGMLSVILFFAIASRNGSLPEPLESFQDIPDCQANLRELSAALRRYHNKENDYPEQLRSLYPRFLASESVFRCPVDRSPKGRTSYIYFRPAPDAPDSTIVLRCQHHASSTLGRRSVQMVTLGGRVISELERMTDGKEQPAK